MISVDLQFISIGFAGLMALHWLLVIREGILFEK